MEPSVALSAVGIASTSIQLFASILKEYSGWRNESSDIERISCKLEDLSQIMTFLRIEFERQSNTAFNYTSSLRIIKCNEILSRLQTELSKLRGSQQPRGLFRRRWADLQRIYYPLRASTIAKLNEDVDELRHHLLWALSERTLEHLRENRQQDPLSDDPWPELPEYSVTADDDPKVDLGPPLDESESSQAIIGEHIDTTLPTQGPAELKSHASESIEGRREGADLLHSDFSIRSPSFFRVGRVFSVLWAEPVSGGNHSLMKDAMLPGRYIGEHVYSKVRRYVVVREGRGSCLCLPIVSYGGQGVAKPGVQKSDHAIIYTGRSGPPRPSRGELPRHGEAPMRDLVVRVLPDHPSEQLDPHSRINLAKVHAIDGKLKVRPFGMVHVHSIDPLVSTWKNVIMHGGDQDVETSREEDPGVDLGTQPLGSSEIQDSTGTTNTLNERKGWMLLANGKFREAEATFSEQLNDAQMTGESQSDILDALSRLAMAYRFQGLRRESKQTENKVADIMRQMSTADRYFGKDEMMDLDQKSRDIS